MKKKFVVLTVSVLALSACSASPTSQESPVSQQPSSTPSVASDPTPSVSGLGTYAGGLPMGGKVTVSLPGEDAKVAALLSKNTDGKHTLAVLDVDNRAGSAQELLAPLEVMSADGKKWTFDSIPQARTGSSAADYNAMVEAYNANLPRVDAGERRTVVLVGDFPALPSDVTRVQIGGMRTVALSKG